MSNNTRSTDFDQHFDRESANLLLTVGQHVDQYLADMSANLSTVHWGMYINNTKSDTIVIVTLNFCNGMKRVREERGGGIQLSGHLWCRDRYSNF